MQRSPPPASSLYAATSAPVSHLRQQQKPPSHNFPRPPHKGNHNRSPPAHPLSRRKRPACLCLLLSFRESFRHPPQTSSSTGKSLFRPLPSDCAPTPYSGSISGKRQAGKEPESSPTCIPRGTMSHSSLCRSSTIYKAITPPLSERRAEAGPRHICPASNAALYSKKETVPAANNGR